MSSKIETLDTFVKKVNSLLEPERQSVIIFTGVPGCGKTYLANKYWEETKELFTPKPLNPDDYILEEANKRNQTYVNFYNESSFKTAIGKISYKYSNHTGTNLIVDNTVFSNEDVSFWLTVLGKDFHWPDVKLGTVVVLIEHDELLNRNKSRPISRRIPDNVYENFVQMYHEFNNLDDSRRHYQIVRVRNDG